MHPPLGGGVSHAGTRRSMDHVRRPFQDPSLSRVVLRFEGWKGGG